MKPKAKPAAKKKKPARRQPGLIEVRDCLLACAESMRSFGADAIALNRRWEDGVEILTRFENDYRSLSTETQQQFNLGSRRIAEALRMVQETNVMMQGLLRVLVESGLISREAYQHRVVDLQRHENANVIEQRQAQPPEGGD